MPNGAPNPADSQATLVPHPQQHRAGHHATQPTKARTWYPTPSRKFTVMGLFDEWTRRHLAADPKEPASPPRPADVSAAIPLVTEDTTTTPLDDPVPPSTMQVIRDVERLQAEYQERTFNTGPDRERLPVTSMTLADVYNPYGFAAGVEESLMLWTEEKGS